MIDFTLGIKTKIYFGKDKEDELVNILNEFSFHKILIVYGQGSIERSGLLDKILNNLNAHGYQYQLLKGVRPNPEIGKVKEGIKISKTFQPDLILAIGGGSCIDTAKCIAVNHFYDGNPFDFNMHKITPKNALPVGVILTISASGSEMSTSCVIQDDSIGVKFGFNSELIRPVFAIENPILTYSVNKIQTAYGVVDIMMHTLERYFQPSDEIEPADSFAFALLKDVIKAGMTAYNNPTDYLSRASLMLLSSLSHNGLTSIGKATLLPVHQLEHALSGTYSNVAHAAGLAVLFPRWARYYLQFDVDKFSELAKNVFGLDFQDKYQNGLEGIKAIESFWEKLGMPRNYEDLGITNIDIPLLVNKVTNNGTRVVAHKTKPLDKDVCLEIYKMHI